MPSLEEPASVGLAELALAFQGSRATTATVLILEAQAVFYTLFAAASPHSVTPGFNQRSARRIGTSLT